MNTFVRKDSIVRKIWGKSDTVLFIFAGASAEFALNKAVNWLYFTGRLPADPLERLFSTVTYAQRIIFMPYEQSIAAISDIRAAHAAVEKKRGQNIPQWSYRDVLYMLISYSITVYELLERKLSEAEKEEVYNVFCRVGLLMGIQKLPETYSEWLPDRDLHLQQDLGRSHYTLDLYKQYRKHLGPIRYWLLLQVQQLICPAQVKHLLNLKMNPLIPPAFVLYKMTRRLRADTLVKALFLPGAYKQQIRRLNMAPLT
ncbi:oxygenase MpaB family protein [Roseivirga sp. BDSF3-8]|uniref:oxygenase MpaB family protein n=1 Tax=Roseivirga sp. BDSF3-8 TaxID=3241598 RepID=UPI003531FB9D